MPRITANQVTFLRLALIPIPCWLLYQDSTGQYAALILATLLGCTDFVDGYLARKHGVTVLGSLMDPIADKVFIAITFMPAVDLHWSPSWLVIALLVREFLVTAARTSYEHRGQQLKSTYLARYKTWVQMCGIGLIMLLNVAPPAGFAIVTATGAIAPLVFLGLRWLLVKKVWRGAVWFAISFGGLFAIHHFTNNATTSTILMGFIVAITWASGLGYLLSVGELRGKGRVRGGELVRLVTSLALPVLAVAAQRAGVAPKWALIAMVSCEMAHGGLDNLLAHHHAEQGGWAWGTRLFLECGALTAVLWPNLPTIWVKTAALVAFGVSGLGLVVAFIQRRQYYLDPKFEQKQRLPTPAPAAP